MAEAEDTPNPPLLLLFAIALSAMLAPLNSTMVAVALPEISRSLQVDSATLRQALVTSYLLTNIVLQSPGGKLSDRLGHRRALALGQMVVAFGAAIAFFWPILPVLTASRVCMALGGAIMLPSATALLRTELPPEMRGRAFGMFGAVMGIAAGTGPTIGAQLVGRFGWTSIFLVNVPILLLSAILARIGAAALKNPATTGHAPQPRFDIAGSTLLGFSLLGVVVGLQDLHYFWVALLGLLGFVPFVLWERRAADPVIDFALFQRRGFMAGSFLTAFQNFALYALIFELPQVAGRLFNLGPQGVGKTLLAMMGPMVLISPLAGRLADRVGGRVVAILGSFVALAGMVILYLQPLSSMSDVVPALVVLGVGMGLTASPSQSVSMSDVPKEKSGMAAGLASTLRYIGGIGGVTVLSLVLTDEPTREVVLRQHHASVLIYCVALGLGIVCTFLLPASAPPNEAPARPATSA
jgi:MFS family permease